LGNTKKHVLKSISVFKWCTHKLVQNVIQNVYEYLARLVRKIAHR